jgi:hypothetical protein
MADPSRVAGLNADLVAWTAALKIDLVDLSLTRPPFLGRSNENMPIMGRIETLQGDFGG